MHAQYKEWSTSTSSRVLLIQGKPGSGKSTLTKYFNDNLADRGSTSNSATVARFFYSYRDGDLQRSHYNMLRTLLYEILLQDQAFFYHIFQAEYRTQRHGQVLVDWNYESLKRVFRSLRDYTLQRPLYLIIDAVDESEEEDRRNVLNMLLDLCANTKFGVVKIFVASRPVGQLEVRQRKVNNFIRLQEETLCDISRFARSALDGLNLTTLLTQATDYIIGNAQGVFLWVKLVTDELVACTEEGHSEEAIFRHLKGLPTELEDFYALMFERMIKYNSYSKDAINIFRLVLWAARPLTVDELLHAVSIADTADFELNLPDEIFQKRIPSKERIIHCGGNFIEVKSHHGNHQISTNL